MAPENSTAGKHNIGSASVACATFPTAAEVSRPRPSAATAHSSRPTLIDAYVDSGRLRQAVQQAEHAEHRHDHEQEERHEDRHLRRDVRAEAQADEALAVAGSSARCRSGAGRR